MTAFENVTKVHNELKKMKVKDLRELAVKLGLKVNSKTKGADILDVLEEKLEDTASAIDKDMVGTDVKLDAEEIIEKVTKANEEMAEEAAEKLVEAVMEDVKKLPEQVESENRVFIGNSAITGEKLYRSI